MKSFRASVFSAWMLAACVVAACGGRVDSVTGESDDTDAGGGGSITGNGDGGRVVRDSGIGFADASVKPDAEVNQCVDISTSSFDTSCGNDDDCIDVTVGHLCTDTNCMCGGAAINASEQDAYVDALGPVANAHSACGCPYLGRPRCVQSQCVFCASFDDGSNPVGCPDGG
ncbi:MAG: hypothetical protein ACRELY_00915 [Polyangiaceae bacterium]